MNHKDLRARKMIPPNLVMKKWFRGETQPVYPVYTDNKTMDDKFKFKNISDYYDFTEKMMKLERELMRPYIMHKSGHRYSSDYGYAPMLPTGRHNGDRWYNCLAFYTLAYDFSRVLNDKENISFRISWHRYIRGRRDDGTTGDFLFHYIRIKNINTEEVIEVFKEDREVTEASYNEKESESIKFMKQEDFYDINNVNIDEITKMLKITKYSRTSGYILYSNAHRDEVRYSLVDGYENPKNSDIMKKLAENWKLLSDEDRELWNTKANHNNEDKITFEKEMMARERAKAEDRVAKACEVKEKAVNEEKSLLGARASSMAHWINSIVKEGGAKKSRKKKRHTKREYN